VSIPYKNIRSVSMLSTSQCWDGSRPLPVSV
jgi:hypothetical protein